MDLPVTPKSTNVLKAKFETLTRKKTPDEDMAELDIMTENLRYLDLTPQSKKSFAAFEPEEYNLTEGETRLYLDPRCIQGQNSHETLFFSLKIEFNISIL